MKFLYDNGVIDEYKVGIYLASVHSTNKQSVVQIGGIDNYLILNHTYGTKWYPVTGPDWSMPLYYLLLDGSQLASGPTPQALIDMTSEYVVVPKDVFFVIKTHINDYLKSISRPELECNADDSDCHLKGKCDDNH